MNIELALGALFFVAIMMANLPFLTQRRFIFFRNKNKFATKAFSFHLLEWLVFYVLLGILVFLLERQLGQSYEKGWEFYIVTLALFAVLAFPGFTYRYLYKVKII